MRIRALMAKDRAGLERMLREVAVFTEEEIGVALELIDIVLENQHQKDYQVACAVDVHDRPIGYICYGPAPMTRGTYDLYWIAVDPKVQGQKIGSTLLAFLEDRLRSSRGRMLLVETSSLPSYQKAQTFYRARGFQEVARIADYYWEGNDRITFCKRIV
ncbi:MAG: GNAT family N-acetyltransferase [Desulfobacterota bacterium]|nr:GNAT family N-acetyltransferase [Thermodesulfobacteriota bacterium]